MLTREKPRSEPLPKSLTERAEPKKAERPTTEIPLEPHWAALVDGATD